MELEDLKEIIELLKETDITELQVEKDGTKVAAEARQANGENQTDPGSMKPEDPSVPRPIRGKGTRGTTGSVTNAQVLASLINNHSTNGTTNGAKTLRLNFRNAPLSLVLNYLSDAAGFIITANSKVDLKGGVTVWSNQMVDRNEAIAILNSALTSSGYGATVEGNLLNIYVVDATNTPIEAGLPEGGYQGIPATKDLVTQIVYINNVEANQLISSLQPLMPSGTSLSAGGIILFHQPHNVFLQVCNQRIGQRIICGYRAFKLAVVVSCGKDTDHYRNCGNNDYSSNPKDFLIHNGSPPES